MSDAAFTPIPEVGMQWGGLLKTRTDIVGPERSPGLTGLFGVLLAVGLALTAVVVADPGAAVDAVSDHRRGGPAAIGVFAFPVALALLGGVGLVWWSRRWRVPGGGKLVDAWAVDFDHVDPARVWRVLETAASTSDPALLELVRDLTAERAQPRSRYQVWVKHSPRDQLMVAIVVTKIAKNPHDPQGGLRSQLDREPVIRRGAAYLDLSALRDRA